MNLTLQRSLILITIIFAIKPFEFIATNIMVSNNFIDLLYPLLFSIILIIILIPIFYLCSFWLKREYLIRIILFTGFLFYLQFFWIQISDIFTSVFVDSSIFVAKYVSLFLIFLLSVSIGLLCEKKKFFKSTFIITTLVLISQIGISISNFNKNIFSDSTVSESYEYDILTDKKSSKNNVYYIILDGMTSLDYLEANSPINTIEYSNFIENIEEINFHHLSKSKSAYNITYLTLASILNLDHFPNNFFYSDRFSFFPFMLYEKNPPNLLKELNKLDYKFYYSGNSGWANCRPEMIENAICLNKRYENILKRYFSNESMIAFLRDSFIFRVQDTILENKNLQTDGINNFYNSIEDVISPNQSSFYFIHNLSPHPPYFDNSCTLNLGTGKKEWGMIENYHQSINCVLKELFTILEKINDEDPNAIVVIQGDHGTEFNYDWWENPELLNYENLHERFSIFNAIKLPENCEKPMSLQYDNVDTIKLVMSCIYQTKAPEPKNKSYAGVYWGHEKFGYLTDVSKKLKKEN